MLRKTIIAVLAIAALGLVVPAAAQAHWAHGPGHRWGSGWHHHGHWHGGFWPGVGIGAGWPYYDYPYYYAEEGYGGCHVVRQRVMTRWGWRFRRVDVCE
jgi:hypothetical protein